MTSPPPRFGPYAERYARFRPTYPAALYDLIDARLGRGPRAHAVDLGAGTGQVAVDLMKRFGGVTAVEPDPEMARLLPTDRYLNVVIARAEEADFPDGSVDAVTVGTAFHWMDAAAVCARAKRWLRAGGALAAFMYDKFTAPEAPEVQGVLDLEGALWEGCKHARLAAFEPYAERIRATGVFARVDPIDLTVDWPADAAALAGFAATTSFGAAYAKSTGDETRYWEDYAARLAAAAGGEPILIRYQIEGAIAS
jgi:SAM-dependent methyltransferase